MVVGIKFDKKRVLLPDLVYLYAGSRRSAPDHLQ